MSWFFLVLAGVFEIGFTTCLKLSGNFSKLLPTLGFAICALSSFGLLTKATESIPLGTAYAVWTGIGAFGTAVVGIYAFSDPADTTRLILLILLISAIIGLKLVS
jgi:quaternary ammonium compound-resistance protein SugE